MKIDGIDPLLLNKIKEEANLKEVQKTERPTSDTRVSREGRSDQNKKADISDQEYEAKLDKAINKLNDNAENDGHPLRFSVRKDSDPWNVVVRDTARNEVVREIPTGKALEVANRLQSLFGVFMDEKR